jgi:hypothetical protein
MERGRRLADEVGAKAVIDQPPQPQPPRRDDPDAPSVKPIASFRLPSEFLRTAPI